MEIEDFEVKRIALAQIGALERQQMRPLRELALGDETARDRIQSIDDQIAAIRATLDA